MAIEEATRRRAEELHEAARKLDDEDEQLRVYAEVLTLDPDRSTTHYNIGLIHKYRSHWAESLAANRRAVELRPDDEAANWNLGIAATALRDWRTARATWHRLGMPIDKGDAPIEADFGAAPVRLNPNGDAEVVWGRRIDPVRVRIANIPFPTSGYRFGDVVLHDGAAVGTRAAGGREYPVFNALELFEGSRFATFEAEISIADDRDLQALAEALGAGGVEFEDWTSNVRVLCKRCSEGQPHEHHDEALKERARDRHVIGIAAADGAQAKAILEGWERGDRRLIGFEQRLGAHVLLS